MNFNDKLISAISKHKFIFGVYELIKGYFDDNISKASAELSYLLLFSIFPFIMFVNSIISKMDIPIAGLDIITEILPTQIIEIIETYLTYISALDSTSPLLIGITLTIISCSRAVSSIMYNINGIYNINDKRHFILNTLISIIFTIGLMLAIFLTFLLLVAGKAIINIVLKFATLPVQAEFLWDTFRYLLAGGFIFLFLITLYYIVPNKTLKLNDVFWGAAFSFISWITISIGFSFYIENMSKYSLLYGSLGAIMILMLWLYLTSTIIFVGAKLNYIVTKSRQ